MIVLKSRREIALMREAGRVVARALAAASRVVEPGASTQEVNAAVDATIRAAGAEPLFLGVPGKVPFPAASCVSVNEEVVHGIPGERILRPGDLVKVDTGCRLAGWCADSAWTFAVPPVGELAARLVACGRRVLELAIAECGTRERWS